MKEFLGRISSRKFLVAFAVQIAGLIALIKPEWTEQANLIAVQVAGIAAMILAALGYMAIEGSIDKANATTQQFIIDDRRGQGDQKT